MGCGLCSSAPKIHVCVRPLHFDCVLNYDIGSLAPTDIEELRRLLLESSRSAESAQRQVAEISATVAAQRDTIDKQERAIADLLAALRGKKRERLHPDQLLLFELGELESVLEEHAAEEQPAEHRRRRQMGRRMLNKVAFPLCRAAVAADETQV